MLAWHPICVCYSCHSFLFRCIHHFVPTHIKLPTRPCRTLQKPAPIKMYKLASLASILTIAITSVLCAPGKHSVHHHQLSSSSGKNSTSSTTPWNAHYRHLRFGQRGYRPNQTRRHALPIPMKSDYPTILGGSLTYTHRTPTRRQNMNTAPTPAPTGYSSSLTSIHINNVKDFSFILPNAPNGE